MVKYKDIVIILGVIAILSTVIYLGAKATSRAQDKDYEECLQDWTNANATLEEAQTQCDMFLE